MLSLAKHSLLEADLLPSLVSRQWGGSLILNPSVVVSGLGSSLASSLGFERTQSAISCHKQTDVREQCFVLSAPEHLKAATSPDPRPCPPDYRRSLSPASETRARLLSFLPHLCSQRTHDIVHPSSLNLITTSRC